MDSAETSEEENNDFEYWADWRPSDECDVVTPQKVTSKVNFDSKNEKSIALRDGNDDFGNWIPPSDLYERSELKRAKRYKKRSIIRMNRLTKEKDSHEIAELNLSGFDQSKISDEILNNTSDKAGFSCESVDNVFNVKRYFDKTGFDPLSESKYFDQSIKDISIELAGKINLTYFNNSLKWEKIINADWGKRIELHDVTNFSNGDLMWGVVCPAIFASIKLWENEYGNICGSAEGKISKEGSSEMSSIYIIDTENLRKILHLTKKQWSFLIEVAQKKKVNLKFEAYSERNLEKMDFLDKLWYFICKRRHFFPDLCLLVKFSGAIKSMRDFKIIPKLTVQEIRDISGQNIP